jgi:hypothetical protein
MVKDALFDHEVDLYITTTMIDIITTGELPGKFWVLLAKKIGGEAAGYTGSNVS